MSTLLNLIWIVFGGWLIWLEYVIGGLILCLTIVGIPFGLQCFKLAGLGLLPFGKDIHDQVDSEKLNSALALPLNILWFLVAGVWIFITHIGLAASYAITIIGLPFALQHLKLGVLALFPFGRKAS